MSVKDYTETIAASSATPTSATPTPDWLKDAHAHAKRRGLDKLTTRDIDKIIAGVRKQRTIKRTVK